jgi:hypothetical protein
MNSSGICRPILILLLQHFQSHFLIQSNNLQNGLTEPLQSITRSLQTCYIQAGQSKLDSGLGTMMQQELSNVPLTQTALANDEFVEQSYERVQQMLTAGCLGVKYLPIWQRLGKPWQAEGHRSQF